MFDAICSESMSILRTFSSCSKRFISKSIMCLAISWSYCDRLPSTPAAIFCSSVSGSLEIFLAVAAVSATIPSSFSIPTFVPSMSSSRWLVDWKVSLTTLSMRS